MEFYSRPSELKFEGNLAENWKIFRRDLEIFIKAADISDTQTSSGRKTAVLLNFIGSKGKDLYNTFEFDEGEKEKFDVVLQKFENYVQPQKNLVLSSFLFNSRNQKDGETFESFVTELKNIVKDCEYKEEERMVMDRIIQGVRDVRLRELLLREKKLTLVKAIEIGRTSVLSREQASVMNAPETVDRIKTTSTDDKKKNKKTWRRYTTKWRKKMEEIIMVTKLKPKTLVIREIICVKNVWTPKLEFNNNNNITFKLDTGADISIIPYTMLDKNNRNKINKQTKLNLETYNGGLLDCVTMGLIQKGVVNKVEINTKLTNKETFIANNTDLFTGLGSFPGYCNIKIDPSLKPTIKSPRRVPLALNDKLKLKLNELEASGVISKCEPKSWVSNLVVVEKKDHTLRVCLDHRDVNKAIIRKNKLIPTVDEMVSKLSGAKIFTVLDLKDGFYHIIDKSSSELCTFSTPLGFYQFLRLPFGISSAPEEFQEHQSISPAKEYVDSILKLSSPKSYKQRRHKVSVTHEKLKPKIVTDEKKYLLDRKFKTKKYYDKRTKCRPDFNLNDNVLYKYNKEWKPAKIVKQIDKRSYAILNENNNILRRNSYHLRASGNEFNLPSDNEYQLSTDDHTTNRVPYHTMRGRETSKPLTYRE
ncbi:uncharacterized protein LOC123302816 [Chrysoperla carnea]|uniref:uncharacterized protein LOC123302816 n=1 Tax=Chrysoperla carnea TaxID=189513 RepID=UPI001D06B1D1|nr:uncharacterized protein LOC123302816 [Chrysoperla carnea]